MKSCKKPDKSFYVFLVKNYIIFTLVMGGFLLLVYSLELMVKERIIQAPRTDKPLGGEKLLAAGRYEELSMKKLMGTEGYFEILDESCRVIYTDREGETESYTQSEVQLISDYRSPYYYTRTEYTTESGEKQILLTQSLYERDTGYRKDLAYMILNEKLQVTAGNSSFLKKDFTERELYFLTARQNTDYEIYKYVFQEQGDRERTLIMHVKKMDRTRYKKLNSLWKIFTPAYLLVYVVTMLLFTVKMHRKVKEPLEMLNKGILAFTKGDRDQEISYRGPKEFQVIFDNFNSMSKKLKESESAKERLIVEKQKMLADISHDLKTPITVIQGYARAVSDGLINRDIQKQYLNTILLKTENLTEMINTFYDYSKLEHPAFALVRKEQDLAEFIREYLAEKYDEIDLSGFLLEVEIPEEEVLYEFDEVQLKRVFENIISNALKHNPEGTTIYVTLQQTERSIRIEIGDNGSGIPGEVKERIFDPFMVGDDSRNNRQGSGLGLAVARKITELHGGALFLEKAGNPAISTLFVIRLLK